SASSTRPGEILPAEDRLDLKRPQRPQEVAPVHPATHYFEDAHGHIRHEPYPLDSGVSATNRRRSAQLIEEEQVRKVDSRLHPQGVIAPGARVDIEQFEL